MSRENFIEQLKKGLLSSATPREKELAQLALKTLVSDAKSLTHEQVLVLSQLAPPLLRLSGLSQQMLDSDFYGLLEKAINAHLAAEEKLTFYLLAAENLGENGFWLAVDPQFGIPIASAHHFLLRALHESEFWKRQGVIPTTHPLFVKLSQMLDRLYSHGLQTIQTDLFQYEQKQMAVDYAALCSNSATTLANIYDYLQRLEAVLQRYTGIPGEQRFALFSQWAKTWHTLQQREKDSSYEHGDFLYLRFSKAITRLPFTEQPEANFPLICQHMHFIIQQMWRYGFGSEASYQANRFIERLIHLKNAIETQQSRYGLKDMWPDNRRQSFFQLCEQEQKHAEKLYLAVSSPMEFKSLPPKQADETLATVHELRQDLSGFAKQYQLYAETAPTDISQALKVNTKQAKITLNRVLSECERLLGIAPCGFCWMLVGSGARDEMQPTSDADSVLLIDKKPQNHPYFLAVLRLVRLLWQLIMPQHIFAIEPFNFKLMLTEGQKYLNTPEDLATQAAPVGAIDVEIDALDFALRWGAEVYTSASHAEISTGLFSRYQQAFAQHQDGANAHSLGRWILQQFWVNDNPCGNLANTLDSVRPGQILRLKDTVRSLTWWALAMKLIYRLPTSARSTHEIIRALQGKGHFSDVWLKELEGIEAKLQAWRWLRHCATFNRQAPAEFLQEDAAAEDVLYVSPPVESKQYFFRHCHFDSSQLHFLNNQVRQMCDELTYSLPAWLTASTEQKEHTHPAFFDMKLETAKGVLTTLSPHLPTDPTVLAKEKEQVRCLARLTTHLTSAITSYEKLPTHWQRFFVEDYVAAIKLAEISQISWLSSEEKPMISSPHRLGWQQNLLALTSEQPDGKAPCAQLSWSEAKGIRYLSPQLTQQLFHTQNKDVGKLNSAQRSATPGQSDVWRLTVKDFSQRLPECNDNTIVGYLKTYPAHLWRQWQHTTLVQRIMPNYGVTGSVAMLQYDAKSESIPVWLSSPAGLIFCCLEDHKHSESSPDIQPLDKKGQAQLAQYAAQLDPYSFSMLVFLTYLMVHEDDQLRNLAWQLFMNAQGATVSKIIPFDTDTCLGPPWIRTADGKAQIKLKSMVFCLDAMEQQQLNPAAIQTFLALDPITVLEEWLKEINVVTAPENTLPGEVLDALYQRWQQIRSVLELPRESKDPMAPIFPCTHLDFVELLNPVLGQAYRQAHQQHTNPIERFTAIAQDYVVVDKMRVSKHTGTLRGASIAALSRTVQASSFHMKPEQALARCQQYRRQQQKVQPLLIYLKQQASWPTAIFEQQISRVIGDMPQLNRQTQERMEQHHQQQNDLERLRTRGSLWRPLAEDPDLSIILILPDSKAPPSLKEWQTTCSQTAKPGLRLVKRSENIPWEVYAHNGKNLIVNGQQIDKTPEVKEGLGEAKYSWDLSSWQKHLTPKPNITALRAVCRSLYTAEEPKIRHLQQLVEETERALKNLAEQRQARISRQPRPETKSPTVPRPESDSDFLLDLQDLLLRQTVLSQLPWGQLPTGKGLDEVLRLLELGGLTELNLQDCAAVPEALVLACVQNSPDLRRLNISGCINLTDNVLVQIAQARSLTRLAARGLPKIKELWQGFLWLTHTPLRFSQLTHLDLRNSTNLVRIHLQAPALRYLHLGECSALNNQEVILETSQLKVLSLQSCVHLSFSRLRVISTALESLDISHIPTLTLKDLKAMLTPEQWAAVRTLTLDGCESLNEWNLLSHYPFLTPLLEEWLVEEWLSADKLLALHSILASQPMAADLARLPIEGRWRLQLGLILFFWQQSRELSKIVMESLSDSCICDIGLQGLKKGKVLTFVLAAEAFTASLSCLKNSNDSVRRFWAMRVIGQIGAAYSNLATQALTACLSCLEDSFHRATAIELVGQIGAVHANLAERALTACLSLSALNDRDTAHIAMKAIDQICATHINLATQALTTSLSYLKYSDWKIRLIAIELISQIAPTHVNLAVQALATCLSCLKDSDIHVRQASIRAVGQIGAAHTNLAVQALTGCLSSLKSPNWCGDASLEAMGQIGIAHSNLASQIFSAYLPYLKETWWTWKGGNSVLEMIGRIGAAHADLARQTFSTCLSCLSDSDNYVLRAALIALGRIGAAHADLPSETFSACLSCLKNPNSAVRKATLVVIGQFSVTHAGFASQALNACLPYLKVKDEDGIRQAVLIALGQIGASQTDLAMQALTVCLSYLKDSDIGVRRASVTTLGQIGAAHTNMAMQVLTVCLSCLKDSDIDVRRASVTALGQIGAAHTNMATQVLTVCLSCLKDSDRYVLGTSVASIQDYEKALVEAVSQICIVHPSVAMKALTAACLLLNSRSYIAEELISSLIIAQPKLVYSLSRKMSDILDRLKNPDKSIVKRMTRLFVSICGDYHIQLGQTLEEYVALFLQQWFIQHPAESKPESSVSDTKLRNEEKQGKTKVVMEVVLEVKSTHELAAPLDKAGVPFSAPKSTPLSSDPVDKNSKIMSHVSVERKKENSETDSKFLLGVLPNSNKFKALEKPVPGDGNCGFNALGITRQGIVNMLRSRVSDPETRRLISTEIHEFCLNGLLGSMQGALDDKYYNQLSKLKGYHAAIASAEQKFNAKKNLINQLFDRQPVNASYMEDKTAPLINRLCQRLEFYKPDHYLKLIEEAKQLHSSVVAAQQNYQAQLESEPTYMAYANAYLIDGERPKLWLGYQTALLYARFSVTPINLYIWKKITPNGKQIACEASHYHYAGEGCVTYHILHTNGYTHFNILEPAETAKLSQQSLLVQHSGSSASSSSRYDPTAVPGFHV